MKVARVKEMRELDHRAIQKFGIFEELLMENAGEAAYFTLLNEFGIINKKFVIFCGIGNNGGDGLVLARKIHSNKGHVSVFILGDRKKFNGAAKTNFEIAKKLAIDMRNVTDLKEVQKVVHRSDCIVDAIFGTGLDREISGIYRDVIQLINESNKQVLSVDIPSGINGDTGLIMGLAVNADYTTTFGLPKLGNLLYPGFEKGGKLYVTHISFPPSLYDSKDLKINTNDPIPIPIRRAETHKGECGKVLFIAGSDNYLGAPYFAAMSFLKAGGGLSYLATAESVASFIGNKGSEIVFVPLKTTVEGSISQTNRDNILEIADDMDMVVLGPGLSLNKETQNLVCQLCYELKKPLLIDGDGLTAVAQDLMSIKKRKAETILTPHPGEMVRIAGTNMTDISKAKIDILQQTAADLNSIIVLKGAHSLIGFPAGNIFINLSGNPGMATAGSGDVLTGTIAAMFGLGFTIEEAVRMGVFVHGLAGDIAAKDIGVDGMIAGDIMNRLPNALNKYRTNFLKLYQNFYHCIHQI